MTWRIPGEPFAVVVDGKQVWFKPLTVKDRTKLALQMQGLDFTSSPEAVEKLYEIAVSYVQKIEGMNGDIRTVLEAQSIDLMVKIFTAIMSGGSLSEDEVKNLSSSSSLPSSVPANSGEAAPTANPDDASTGGEL